MRRVVGILGLLLCVIFLVAGVARVKINTNVLEILPRETPGMAEMRMLNSQLSDEHQIQLLVEDETGSLAIHEEELNELASILRDVPQTQRVYTTRDQAPGDGDLAKVIAYLWLNGASSAFDTLLAERLAPEAMIERSQMAVDVISESFDPVDIFYASHDPMGLSDHPYMQWQRMAIEDLEASSDEARLIMLEASPDMLSYRDRYDWVASIRSTIESFQDQLPSDHPGKDWIFGLSGSPAFAAEMGHAMEQDLTGTAGIAAVLIVLLFFLFQRSIRQLLAVSLCLAITCLVTLGVYGWTFQTIGLISAGFAAILMGLVVDYGMILSREIGSKGNVKLAVSNCRSGILWAALTTAATFGVLMLSSLPGGRQLGFLVSVGLVVGAVVMLVIYPRVGFGVKRPSLPVFPQPALPGRRMARWILALLGLATLGTLSSLDPPKISFDMAELRPQNSQAYEAWKRLESYVPMWGKKRLYLVADNREGLPWDDVRQDLQDLESEGVIKSYYIPESMSPSDQRFRANGESFLKLADGFGASLDRALDTAGLVPEAGMVLSEVVGYWSQWQQRKAHEVFEELMEDEVFRSEMVRGTTGETSFLGGILLSEKLNEESHRVIRALDREGIRMASWEMLRFDIVPLFQRDVVVVLIPMAIVLLIAICVALRTWRESMTSITILVLGLLTSICAIRLVLPEWNFVSVIGFPLLLGAGLDYTLHLTFSLRREAGDTRAVFRSTGLAVIFCTLSTMIGFLSLLAATNEAISDLGIVVSTGIAVLSVFTVVLLPGLLGRKA